MTPLIVSTVTSAYIPIAQNWLAALRRLNLASRVQLITLDEESRNAFDGSDVAILHRPCSCEDLNLLWVHRTQVLVELLEQGQDVLHSDLDAVWVADPLPSLYGADADLVFSQGTLWPLESHARRGFVLCCGLFLLRPTVSTCALAKDWLERVHLLGDDQAALNHLIDERFNDWMVHDPYEIKFRDKRFIASRSPMRATAGDMQIAVMPHALFPRLVNGLDGVLVAHPLSGKTMEEARDMLVQKGLWCL